MKMSQICDIDRLKRSSWLLQMLTLELLEGYFAPLPHLNFTNILTKRVVQRFILIFIFKFQTFFY